MITKVALTNFKRFDAVELEIRPITLLLGANSSGKSSVLQALLLLRQSMAAGVHFHRVVTTGPHLDLGRFTGLVHQQRRPPSGPDIGISLGIDNVSTLEFQLNAIDWAPSTRLAGGILDKLVLHESSEDKPDITGVAYWEVTSAETGLWYVGSPALSGRIVKRWVDTVLNTIELRATVNAEDDDEEAVLPKRTSEGGSMPLESTVNEVDPQQPRWLSQFDQDVSAILMAGKRGHLVIKCLVVEGKLKEASCEPSSGLDEEDRRELESVIHRLYRQGQVLLDETVTFDFYALVRAAEVLAQTTWVAPIRAVGARTYGEETNEEASLSPSGDNIAAVLTPQVQIHVARFLKMLGLDYEVDVVPAGVTSTATEVVLERMVSGIKHTVGLPDVGSGVAQILPVLAACAQAASRNKASLLMFQQPELHLHPKQQGDLASVFADVVRPEPERPTGSRLLVETHSETLVLALQALVHERKLKPEDVAIYVTDIDDEQRAGLTLLEIDEDGDLIGHWPRGFFPDATILRRRRQ